MKHILTFILFLCAVTPALAESLEKPAETSAIYIAMLQQKLSGAKPNFEAWVEESPDFRNAALHERFNMMQQKKDRLKTVYGLLSVAEPIVLEIPVRMTGYSLPHQGFLLPAFANPTFFLSYTYMGKNYAIIPDKITDYEWLKSPPELASSIMKATDNGYNTKILMTLTPHSTDKDPVLMKGKKYYLVMTEVSKLEIWTKNGERTVWDSQMNKPKSPKNRLLNLYQ